MTVAYVGFGANLGDAVATYAAAARALCAVPQVASVRASSLWHSKPVGDVDQPWFKNGCFAVSFAGEARALLGALLAIEAGLGRDRRLERKGGPRTCDLDLLLIDDQVIDEPELTVPHPRLHERAFVLAPLVELAGPDLWVPGHGRAGELLSRVRATWSHAAFLATDEAPDVAAVADEHQREHDAGEDQEGSRRAADAERYRD